MAQEKIMAMHAGVAMALFRNELKDLTPLQYTRVRDKHGSFILQYALLIFPLTRSALVKYAGWPTYPGRRRKKNWKATESQARPPE